MSNTKDLFVDGQQRTGYRIDGGAESDYTANKENAIGIYEAVTEDFGEACIWEITEEYSKEDGWEIVEENIILSNKTEHDVKH